MGTTLLLNLDIQLFVAMHKNRHDIERPYQRMILLIADTIHKLVHEFDHGTEVALVNPDLATKAQKPAAPTTGVGK